MRGRSEDGVMQVEAGPYSRHIPALDGVRGLAVLGVLGTHVFVGNASTPLEQFLAEVARFGAGGVDLFFVLSGMLITGILYDSLGERAYFRTFYARRALRIFPLYYGVLLCFAATTVFLGKHYQHELLSLALYLQNTSWVAPPIWVYKEPPMLPLRHFWTLAVEEQFYLTWPLAVFVLRDRRRLLAVCLVGIVVAFVLRVVVLFHTQDWAAVNAGTVYRMDSLLCGAALALLLRGPMHDRVLKAAGWVFGVTAFVLGLYFVDVHVSLAGAYFLHSLNYTVLAVASVGLIALSLRPGGTVARAFSVAGMRWLGRYSYGIYVLHMILRQLLLQPTKNLLRAHGMKSPGAVVIVAGVVMMAMALGAAWVSYHAYEVRFLRLKRRFAYGRVASTSI